jgi:transcriptional regulator with XRE-family HTH domain
MNHFAENKVYLIGNNICHARKMRHLSQTELAEKADVSEADVIAAENDDAISLSAVTLLKLMRTVGLDNNGNIPAYILSRAADYKTDLSEGCFGITNGGVLFATRCKDQKRFAVFLYEGKPLEVEVTEYIPHLDNLVQKLIFQFAAGNHVDDLVMQLKTETMAEKLKNAGPVSSKT